MGSRVPPTETFGRQNEERARDKRSIADALRIDGSQFIRLYEKMLALFAGLEATVTALVTALTYTKAELYTNVETDGLVASPGAIAPTTVTATSVTAGTVTGTGGVTSGGDLTSAGKVFGGNVYGNVLPSAYRVQYVMSNGEMGYVPSSARFKMNIADVKPPINSIRQLRLRKYRYKEAVRQFGPDADVEVGLIAEEVAALGLGFLIDRDEDGSPFGVSYDKLSLALLALLLDVDAREQALRLEVESLSARVIALEGHSQ